MPESRARKTTKKAAPAKRAAEKGSTFESFAAGFDGHETITLHKRWTLKARLVDLQNYVDNAAEGGDIDSDDVVAAAKEAEQIRAAYDDSAVDVTIRALTRKDITDLAMKLAMLPEDYDFRYEQIAVQVTSPKMTADEWQAIEPMLGAAQFDLLWYTVDTLVDNVGVVPDFSPAMLAALSTTRSSENSESPEHTASGSPSSSAGATKIA